MPFRTRYGTHYHENQGCSAIAGKEVESCGADGLEPCSLCCGGGRSAGGLGAGAASSGGAGACSGPSGGGGTASRSLSTGASGTQGGASSEERVVTGAASGAFAERPMSFPSDEAKLRLMDSLLVVKAGLDGLRDGQEAPSPRHVMSTPDEVAHATRVFAVATSPSGSLLSPDDMVVPASGEDIPRTPEAEFRARREKEFVEDFRRHKEEEIRRWNDEGWQEWRAEHADLARYMLENMRRERPAHLARFVEEEVESIMRQRYEDEVPCPCWGLADQWQRMGRLLHGREDRWPGYAEAKAEWDAESERMWEREKRCGAA